MSDDLISRSALMQSLRGNVLVDVTPNLEQAIKEQPTAYDVDKVVEQMESILETTNIQLELSKDFQPKESESAKSDIIFLTQRKRLCEELIETVKSGGIERDW